MSPEPAFRCAVSALQRRDDPAGTATHLDALLLVEQDRTWGTSVLKDGALPADVRRHLGTQSSVKVLCIRRHHRSDRTGRLRAFVAFPASRQLFRADLSAANDLLELDLAALAARRPPAGWRREDRPIYAACTHGRHDVCCAELGRPVAAALSTVRPDAAWEVSHIGGDRFAGNVLVLPHGLYYGQMTAPAALELPLLHEDGRLDLARLRGSPALPMPAQFAEIALRRHLAEDRIDGLQYLGRTGETHVLSRGEERWEVSVARTRGVPVRMTCGATRESPAPGFEVVSLRQLPASS